MTLSKAARAEKKLEKQLDIAFALDVKERDNFECVICHSKDRLNCHHIIPRENRLFRHNINNGITLCILHHKFSLEISPHKNAFAFFQWLIKNRIQQLIAIGWN